MTSGGGASDEAVRKKQCPIGDGSFDLFRSAGRNRQHDKQAIGQRGKHCVASTLYHPRVTEMTSGGASDEAIRKKQCPIGGGTFDLFRTGRRRTLAQEFVLHADAGAFCLQRCLRETL